ncbi:hypothetical protein ABKN59_010810 [Abortiporus biennis]
MLNRPHRSSSAIFPIHKMICHVLSRTAATAKRTSASYYQNCFEDSQIPNCLCLEAGQKSPNVLASRDLIFQTAYKLTDLISVRTLVQVFAQICPNSPMGFPTIIKDLSAAQIRLENQDVGYKMTSLIAIQELCGGRQIQLRAKCGRLTGIFEIPCRALCTGFSVQLPCIGLMVQKPYGEIRSCVDGYVLQIPLTKTLRISSNDMFLSMTVAVLTGLAECSEEVTTIHFLGKLNFQELRFMSNKNSGGFSLLILKYLLSAFLRTSQEDHKILAIVALASSCKIVVPYLSREPAYNMPVEDPLILEVCYSCCSWSPWIIVGSDIRKP